MAGRRRGKHVPTPKIPEPNKAPIVVEAAKIPEPQEVIVEEVIEPTVLVPEKTELQHFAEMLKRAGVDFKVTPAHNTNVTLVRIGDLYSYSIWTFDPEGLLKSQHQYETAI